MLVSAVMDDRCEIRQLVTTTATAAAAVNNTLGTRLFAIPRRPLFFGHSPSVVSYLEI